MKKPEDYGYVLREKLHLISKGSISYEFQVIEKIEENGLEEVSFKSKYTNDIEKLKELATMDINSIEFDEEDYELKHKDLDSRFPIIRDKSKFYKHLNNKELYEVEYNENGRITYIKNKKIYYKNLNLFDNNDNILLSVMHFSDNKAEYRKEYTYDNKGRLTKYSSILNYIGYTLSRATIEAEIRYDEENKTSMTTIKGEQEYKIFTQWDDDYKRPLFDVSMKSSVDNVFDISEYSYEGNKTIIRSKHMNIML